MDINQRRNDIAALSAVLLTFALIFAPSLVRGYFPLVADSFCYSYPLRITVFNMIRSGQWPLWTHELLSGYPLLSMAQIGVAYPLTWTYLFLPPQWAETVYVLAPYLLAPAFTYAYCRELGRTRMAALFAGLSFGYGGFLFSKYTSNGMLANAVMWLPLILIALERSRRGSFLKSVLLASTAYSLSVLTGIGQGFVFTGLVALGYALFLIISLPLRGHYEIHESVWSSRDRWSPLAVMMSALVLAGGIAAFQIFETAQASALSIRRSISYETFSEGSLTLQTIWRSILLTFYAYEAIDVSAFMAPVVIILIVPALIYFGRKRHRDSRVFFWIATAAVAIVLMLGANTFLYQFVYHIPVLNRFRVPARHSLEWSFALAVLGAYGWDALAAFTNNRFRSPTAPQWRRDKGFFIVGSALLLLAFATGVWWLQAVGRPESPFANQYSHLPRSTYLLFKAAHTLILLACLVVTFRVQTKWRQPLLTAIIMLACLTEPYILFRSWWLPLHKTERELSTSNPAMATKVLQQFPAEHNRIYTRVNLFEEIPRARDKVNPHNLTMLFGLHNTAGYEPFILERYSRLLGNVGVDSVNPRPGFPRDENIFAETSHVLDLLNTTFVVGYSNLSTTLVGGNSKQGIEFPSVDLSVNLKPGEHLSLRGFDVNADSIALVSSLSHSPAVEDGSVVARVHVATDSSIEELNVLAGRDTAEWAHERPDVRGSIKHRLAPVFDSIPGDEQNSFQANRYWTVLPLSSVRRIESIDIENVSATASIAVWKAVAHDRTTQVTIPLNTDSTFLSAIENRKRWERQFSQNGLLILKNLRSRDRAWLVNTAEASDEENALRRVRGEAGEFDPFKAAFVEVGTSQLPSLDSNIAPGEVKQLTYKPNALEVVTESSGRALLVISQTNYPGWVASVDGQTVPLYATDYVVQSVAVPAGRHLVELRYTAPAAKKGAIISVLALILIGVIAIRAHRASGE